MIVVLVGVLLDLLPLPSPSLVPLPVVTATPTLAALPVATPTLAPLPLTTPTLPPLPVATPTLPPLPVTTPTPAAAAPPSTGPAAPTPGPTTAPGAVAPAPSPRTSAPGSGPTPPPPVPSPVGFLQQIPEFLSLPPGPIGQAIGIALILLPVALVIWLFTAAAALEKSLQWRGTALRLAIAGELGVRPRDLAAMPPHALRALREQLAFDELTGVLLRPAGMAALEREIARARRRRRPLSVAFADLDGLKALNDGRGHAAGDALLHLAGKTLKEGMRTEDVVFRFGGDEFVCLLPETPAADAGAVMARIKAAGSAAGCEFSFGVAEMERDDDEVKLLARADERLYQAKAARPEGVGRKAVRSPLQERLRVT